MDSNHSNSIIWQHWLPQVHTIQDSLSGMCSISFLHPMSNVILSPPLHVGWKMHPKSVHIIKQCTIWWLNKLPMCNMTKRILVVSGIIWNVSMIGMITNIRLQFMKKEECIWDVCTGHYSCFALFHFIEVTILWFQQREATCDMATCLHQLKWHSLLSAFLTDLTFVVLIPWNS